MAPPVPLPRARGGEGEGEGGAYSAHHLEVPVVTGLVLEVEELVAELRHHVDGSLVADERVAVLVDAVEVREAEPEERDLRVPGGELAVRVADHGIDWIRDEQRAEVPEVAVHVDLRS